MLLLKRQLENIMKTKEFLSKKEIDRPELVIFHNLEESSLFDILFKRKWKGLAAPKLQIKPIPENNDIDKNDSFFRLGEITLIFDKENIFGFEHKIENRTNHLFLGEESIVEMPHVSYDFSKKHLDKLKNTLLIKQKNISETTSIVFEDSVINFMNESLNAIDELKHILYQSITNKIEFLETQNISIKIPSKDIELPELVYYNPLNDYLKNENMNDPFSNYFDKEGFLSIWEKTVNNCLDKIYFKSNKEKYTQFYEELIYFRENILNRNEINKYYKSQHHINNKTKVVDFKKLDLLLDNKMKKLEIQYSEYIEKQCREIFIKPHLEWEDKYESYSLENVSKWMYKKSLELTDEKIKYISKNDIFVDLKEISSKKDVEEYLKESFRKKLEIYKILFKKHSKNTEDEIEVSLETETLIKESIQFLIRDVANHDSPNLEIISKILIEHEFIEKLTNTELNTIKSNSIFISNKPIEYFTSQSFLPYYFKEEEYMEKHEVIKGIILPRNIDKRIKEVLKKSNIKIHYYNKNDLSTRIKAIKKFKESFLKY
jgi:hypothetical protein